VAHFAVTTVRGAAYDDSREIREQDGWDDHAAFMDGLLQEGLIVLGGPFADAPLEGRRQALLLFDAESEEEVRRRMADDPWAAMDMLHVGSVEPWLLWLDGR
jgi:uncharacterized protein YciI